MICAAFLGLGTSLLLYVKARTGPDPFAAAVILACVILGEDL